MDDWTNQLENVTYFASLPVTGHAAKRQSSLPEQSETTKKILQSARKGGNVSCQYSVYCA